jgi:hypothetical protein
MIKRGVSITIHPWMSLLLSSGVAMNIIPAINVMRKPRITRLLPGRKKNGTVKPFYAEFVKRN